MTSSVRSGRPGRLSPTASSSSTSPPSETKTWAPSWRSSCRWRSRTSSTPEQSIRPGSSSADTVPKPKWADATGETGPRPARSTEPEDEPGRNLPPNPVGGPIPPAASSGATGTAAGPTASPTACRRRRVRPHRARSPRRSPRPRSRRSPRHPIRCSRPPPRSPRRSRPRRRSPRPRPPRSTRARRATPSPARRSAPTPTIRPRVTPPVRGTRRTPWRVMADFVRSFADQPESYHSDLAREPLPDDGRGEPHSLRRARELRPRRHRGRRRRVRRRDRGVPALDLRHHRDRQFRTVRLRPGPRRSATRIGAIALAVSALLSVRMRVFRWLTVVLSFVIAGFVVRDLLQQLRRHADDERGPVGRRQRRHGPLDHGRLGRDRDDRVGPPQRGPENRLTRATLRCLPGAATHQGDAPAPATPTRTYP